MPISIISSPSALSTQNSLREATENIATSINRLSSGQRVFSAAEDAAALAIGSGLRVETSALRSAIVNTATGSSMLQVASGALSEIRDILIRMNSVAAQSSSGQLSDTERTLLNQEYTQLKAEIDRIAGDTDFNGEKLLVGDALYDVDYAHAIQAVGISNPDIDSTQVTSDATFRLTYNTVDEDLRMYRIDGGTGANEIIDLTQLLDNVAGVGQNLSAGESVTVNFSSLGISVTLDDAFDRNTDMLGTVTDNSGGDIAISFAAPILPETVSQPLIFQSTNVSSEVTDAFIALDAGSAYSIASGLLTLGINTDGTAVTLAGTSGIRYDVNGGGVGADGAASADLVTGAAGYVDIYLTTASGSENIGRMVFDGVTTSGTTDGTLVLPLGKGLFDADYNAAGGTKDLDFMVGSGVTANQDIITISLSAADISALGLTTNTVSTLATAEASMVAIATALNTINSLISTIGADQGRMDSIAKILTVNVENMESARSVLLDTDVPAELSKLANDQALSEVGIAMLSQINQQPARLLRLLQG